MNVLEERIPVRILASFCLCASVCIATCAFASDAKPEYVSASAVAPAAMR